MENIKPVAPIYNPVNPDDKPSGSGLQVVEPTSSLSVSPPAQSPPVSDNVHFAMSRPASLCEFCKSDLQSQDCPGVWSGPCGHLYHVKCIENMAKFQYQVQKNPPAILPLLCVNEGCKQPLLQNIVDDISRLNLAIIRNNDDMIKQIIKTENKPFLLKMTTSNSYQPTLLLNAFQYSDSKRHLLLQTLYDEATQTGTAGRKRKRDESESGTGEEHSSTTREDQPSQTKRFHPLAEEDHEIMERSIALCCRNVKNYQDWLDSELLLPKECPQPEEGFIPVTRSPLFTYDGKHTYINTKGLSKKAADDLQTIQKTVKPPRQCIACPTPPLAKAILESFPPHIPTAVFVPMAGAGILAEMIAAEAKKSGKDADVFACDVFPTRDYVRKFGIGQRGVNPAAINESMEPADSFQAFYIVAGYRDMCRSIPDKNPELMLPSCLHRTGTLKPYGNFVMLLDFPQFNLDDTENCPLHIAIEKFMLFPTAHNKQIVYWGAGKITGDNNEILTVNPFEQAVSRYNAQAREKWGKKRPLVIKDIKTDYPKSFNNEVLQQVCSKIPTPEFDEK